MSNNNSIEWIVNPMRGFEILGPLGAGTTATQACKVNCGTFCSPVSCGIH